MIWRAIAILEAAALAVMALSLIQEEGNAERRRTPRTTPKGRTAMPRGASPKREHEYEKIKTKMQHEGRYKGREEEVAARIVNKQRREIGETKAKQR